MSTIPQQLRGLAGAVAAFDGGLPFAESMRAIAAELEAPAAATGGSLRQFAIGPDGEPEDMGPLGAPVGTRAAPAADAVPVVAWLAPFTGATTSDANIGALWVSDQRGKPAQPLVRQSDHIATVSALQAEMTRLRDIASEAADAATRLQADKLRLRARINALEARQVVPDAVLEAVNRMSTPIDASWGIPAATAEADAYSMSLIREFVLSLSQPDTSKEQP